MSRRPAARSRRAFTMVEAVVGVLVAVLVLGSMYQLFTQTLRNTTTGTDLINAIREAHALFSSIRKDLLAATEVVTPLGGVAASLSMAIADVNLPDPTTSPYPQTLQFTLGPATATYTLVGTAGKMSIERHLLGKDLTGNPVDTLRRFAVPRMKGFRALLVTKGHATAATGSSFSTRHVFVQIVLQSDEKYRSKREICLTSFFTPSNIAQTNWNYF